MTDIATTTQATLERPAFKNRYDNYIGGQWVAPTLGQYFENRSPVDGHVFTHIPRSTAEDVEG